MTKSKDDGVSSDPVQNTQSGEQKMANGKEFTKVTKNKKNKSSYFKLYEYATRWDKFLLVIGAVMAFIKALVHPYAIVVCSELISMFIDRNLGLNTSPTILLPLFGGGKVLMNGTHTENMEQLKKDSISFGILITLGSIVMFLTGIAYVDLFNHVALKLVSRMRRKFFEAMIRKEIGWHDISKDQSFAVRITDGIEKIRGGIAENVGHFIQLLSDIIISIIIAFIYGWKLTLAVFIYVPITIIVNIVVIKFQSKLTVKEQDSYACASSVAEEVFAAIRTVVAFGGEKLETKRYEERLDPARKAGKQRGAVSGLNDSVLKAMVFLISAATFWYGANLILGDRHKPPEEQEYTATVLMVVLFGIVVSADHISRTTPFLEAFATARGSAVSIFEVIESKSKIDPLSTDGKVLNYGLRGSIEFKDVFFCYPSREDVVVMRNFNLKIAEGQTVALVGASGSGKSTCIQLVQRFYDPEFGKVMIDNEDIKNYNIGWLRSKMAVVGQEPVLFQGTIGENIRHGKPDATQKEVEDASRAAGAHDFIIALPQHYNTVISEKGVQLSGGQRQRIAIARALINKPKILLLDEATSALDYHSEKLVQAALDKASKGRTTLVVSHRLSAIRHADRIVFMEDGRIIEEGTHEELVKLEGRYAEMVKAHEYDNSADELLDDLGNETVYFEKKQSIASANGSPQPFESIGKQCNAFQGEKSSYLNYGFDGEFKSEIESIKSIEECDSEVSKDFSYTMTFFRVLQSARPEWFFLILGAICAGIYGCAQPAFAVIYSELYAALAEPEEEVVLSRTSKVAIVSICIGIVSGIVCYTQTYFFNLAGVWLTTRMRSWTFSSIMNQEVGWFDRKENNVGGLSARLAGDAASVQAAIGFPLSNIIQAITNFICSFSIAFYYSWELSLICLCTSPFMVASIVFEAKFSTKSAIREKEILEETSSLATETITQIRTVAGLHREAELIEAYNDEIERYKAQIKKRLRFRGLINSMGMAIMFFGYAITFTYGGIMCADGKMEFSDVMKIANTMLYGLFILAQSLAFTPAFNAAIVSANRLYQIIDRQPKIQSPNDNSLYPSTIYNGLQVSNTEKEPAPPPSNVKNGVLYRDINFAYPTRRRQQVLRNFNLSVPQSRTVALVGASGSGKSTCVQLLQRYYDPDTGKLFLDQNDIHRDLSLRDLRRNLGIVSQEPSLFEKTIAENIAYGDNTREVALAEIIEAAKMANAHDFITALPSGYDTCLGAKGTQLSGGQKQRIAIARAILRSPKILLLDEATSALDLQSERVVQAALDHACSGRTCIVIAHRLATVQNAHLICVMHNGRIVERGNHPQLMAANGIYAKLYRSQPNT